LKLVDAGWLQQLNGSTETGQLAHMNPIRRHKNVTFKRLALDAYQFVRAQRPVVAKFGVQFQRSRDRVEIDLTYKCNLRCLNCNRSCTQLPSDKEIALPRIEAFLNDSIASQTHWKRIRLLGGEPTLHSRIFDIVELLVQYKQAENPGVRIVLCTNDFGRRVKRILSQLPDEIEIKSALKSSRTPLFRPFNRAPIDMRHHRFSDFSCGCRILKDCGIGLTPSGYYACAVAGGIDRVFGFNIGREALPAKNDTLVDQLGIFCRLCGHFGFAWPVKRQVVSATWQKAYQLASADD
jgi:hypothetical protein